MIDTQLIDDEPQFDSGSFRDPAGRVFFANGRVFRSLSDFAGRNFESLNSTGCYERLIAEGILLPTRTLKPEEAGPFAELNASMILEHEKIRHISYAYEWPFSLLKRAALAHLDLHISCLKDGFTLVDGNTYNVQFSGVKPQFIDIPSIVPHKEGEAWFGYAQFCEQFVAPLMLSADIGVPFHPWLRGSPNGVPLEYVCKLLPLRKHFSFNRLVHIVLHNRMQKKYAAHGENVSADRRISRAMTKERLGSFLLSLRHLVDSMKIAQSGQTEWENYENLGHYGGADQQEKMAFVAYAVEQKLPDILWDIGCNTGQFAQIALAAGAKSVVGFDVDLGALDIAVERATQKSLNFLPLYFDALNPSPNQGWAERERGGIISRSSADMIVALAVIHHIVISGDIPLRQAIEWIVGRAKSGVIEFVTREDPMVKRLLANREDHFDDYNVSAFEAYMLDHCQIVKRVAIQGGDRILYSFETKKAGPRHHG
jgi:SAM-dependent methyltransferase